MKKKLEKEIYIRLSKEGNKDLRIIKIIKEKKERKRRK